MISYGTILKAKPIHPIYQRGGSGIAFVTDNAEGSDFFTFMWVNGDPAAPGFNGDVGAIAHIDNWFDLVPSEEHDQHLPQGFTPPPNPKDDPHAAFEAMFDIDDQTPKRTT